eukprot:jgi/Phyca11/120495/e_gw1.41.430.1
MPIEASAPIPVRVRPPSAGINSHSNADVNVQDLPVFDAKSSRVFNPREPAGRYSLHLSNAYDKMIAMELVRLASTRKGCRFLQSTLETRGLDALFANVDRDKSGYVDQDELMAVLNQIGLFPRMENLTCMLEKFDYNRSGFLEEGEFSAFFFHAVFQMIDEDHSGKIDADEVEEAFEMLGIDNYDEKEISNAI